MAVTDTHPEAEKVLLQGYAEMEPAEKLQRVVELNRCVEEFAAARIRAEYGPKISDRELALRLAALRLDRETMIEVFGWDSDARGL